jgi:hypothetical protein
MDISSRFSEFSLSNALRGDRRRSSSGGSLATTNVSGMPPSLTAVAPEITCDDLREQLGQFTAQLDQYVIQCKSSVQTQQQDWHATMVDQRDQIHQLEQQKSVQQERQVRLTLGK